LACKKVGAALAMGEFADRLRATGFGDAKIAAKNVAVYILDELHANTLFSAVITALMM
jgi:hypothetical protein